MGLLEVLNTTPVVLTILLLFSFLPPVMFLVWVRNTERYGREPWAVVIKMFLWGAVFAVIIAIVLSLLLAVAYNTIVPVYVALGNQQTLQTIVLALVIAPFVEEGAKAIGVFGATFNINQVQDGIVYGASSGLGFSATENLFYGVAVLIAMGPALSISLIVLRSVSSTLLHASATSAVGYGIGKNVVSKGRYRVLPFYLLAVGMHSCFNFFASFGELLKDSLGDYAGLIGFAAAWILAIVAFSLARARIIKDEKSSPVN